MTRPIPGWSVRAVPTLRGEVLAGGQVTAGIYRLAIDHPQLALFEARTGQSLACILPRLQQAEADGLLQIGPERIAPTLLGRRFLNRLLERFL